MATGPARLIVIEGIDGCGKSTQVERLAEAHGWLATREPGGTELGREIRSLLLHSEHAPVPTAEALMMAADRAEHVATVVKPTLDSGRSVISDRYAASTIAYQGWGHQREIAELEAVNAIATAGLRPDLTILLDLDVALAAERRGLAADRLESLDAAFHERVRQGYLAQAAADPEGWVVVDASRGVDDVSAAVDAAVGA